MLKAFGVLIFSIQLAHAGQPMCLPKNGYSDLIQFAENFSLTSCVFRKPVVVGASVSAGFPNGKEESFINHAARIEGKNASNNLAVDGSPSTHIASIPDSSFKEASAIFAIDAFYWDYHGSTGPKISASSEAPDSERCKWVEGNIDTFFKRMSVFDKPLVVGTIPNGCVYDLNQKIRDKCSEYKDKCTVFDTNKILSDLKRPPETMEIDGITYQKRKMVAQDSIGLHPIPPFTKYLGKLLHDHIQSSNMICP